MVAYRRRAPFPGSRKVNRVGILYPGDLGAALGHAITKAGGTVVTCLAGRSAATISRAEAASFRTVSSLEEVAQVSDIVVSVIPASSAIEVARSFAASLANCDDRRGEQLIFVDANSVAPRTKREIGDLLRTRGVRYVDGAFFGPASRIGQETVLALSGSAAVDIAPMLGQAMEVRVLGAEEGQASALKMAMAIMTKGIPALFLESVCAAMNNEQLDSTLEMIGHLYPGILSFLERTVPTYPTHIERRVHELDEAAKWLQDVGQCGVMTQAAISVLERLRRAEIEGTVRSSFKDVLFRI